MKRKSLTLGLQAISTIRTGHPLLLYYPLTRAASKNQRLFAIGTVLEI